jgi:phage tail-like protein
MLLLEELERVLDPVVILLDNLASHLEPATAPTELIDFLLEMVGAPVDGTLLPQARRGLAADDAQIARRRGTKAGLQLALEHVCPDLQPKVIDNGHATWAGSSEAPSPTPAPPASRTPTDPSFEVLLARMPDALQEAQIARCVADHLPLGASYRYRVTGE